MNKRKFRLFLLAKLPSAFICGLKLHHLDETKAQISVKFGWLNQNPFRSMFWAVEGMAAELSTGLPAVLEIEKVRKKSGQSVSMLLIEQSGKFDKKAVGNIIFTCDESQKIKDAIAETVETGEAVTVWITSQGVDEDGDVVGDFRFLWSYKLKVKK